MTLKLSENGSTYKWVLRFPTQLGEVDVSDTFTDQKEVFISPIIFFYRFLTTRLFLLSTNDTSGVFRKFTGNYSNPLDGSCKKGLKRHERHKTVIGT